MKMPVYSYRDNKVGFMSPMIDQNDDSAIRGFSYAINNREGIMGFSPADFDLYQIGVFDSDTGIIESTSAGSPLLIVSGTSVVNVK